MLLLAWYAILIGSWTLVLEANCALVRALADS